MVAVSALVFANIAFAETFSNQFVEFNLPSKWKCVLDGTEWVCQSTDEQRKRDAIIVLAAKIRKPGMDELPTYKGYLEQKQQYTAPDGQEIISEPKFVKENIIAGHKWIDALHSESEIPDFFTRYLATTKDDIGILVTFSVRKDKYDQYSPDILAMVQSLRAFRKPGVLNATGEGGDGDVLEGAGDGVGEDAAEMIFDDPMADENAQVKKPKKGGAADKLAMILVVIVIAAGVGFIIYKKKKQG